MRSVVSAPLSQRRPTGPPHKPMTYVQQLKSINKAATINKQPGRTRLVQGPFTWNFNISKNMIAEE